MELLSLPITSNKTKTYKHYSLHTTPVVSTASVGKTEFYYIGSNSSRIDKLIRIFESGYATESCINAKSMLLRLQSYSHSLPHIIICDSTLGYEAIKDFRQFLALQKDLRNVPFVLDDQGMNKDMSFRYRKEKIVDEIISLEGLTKESLLAKARFLNKIKSRATDKTWTNKIETSNGSYYSQNSVGKRAFDILVSSLALIVLSPILLLIALAIRLESKGSIFYVAKRAGRGYKIFNFYKFRTMIVGADSKISEYSHLNQYNSSTEGPKFYKIENDPRITKVGAFLRKSSLDELPQLINVLLGDMSLVGNRPLPLYEAATLTTDEWAKRFLAPAGITGLWQIKKRGNKDMSVEERIKLDIYYANKYNFAYDLWIMANTPTALIQKTNA
ncbi:MAG TPA: sugar transferase [Chitinophagaceae bacterium]|nr:sugar transferase [Chitinophagaceae bacterium]